MDLHYENMKRFVLTPDRWQWKMLILSTNVDKKFLETEFLIVICLQIGDKWQSKTLFLSIFDRRSSIVKNVFDCRPSAVCSFTENCIFGTGSLEECAGIPLFIAMTANHIIVHR